MKNLFLFTLCMAIVFSAFSQDNPFQMEETRMRIEQPPNKIKKSTVKRTIPPLPEIPPPNRDVNIVNVIDIGTSANAFTYWEKLSYLWVDPVLNTVTNIHRMGGTLDPGGHSGDLGYDISKDGGQTWENMIDLFEGYPVGLWFTGARSPQAGIYNPTNNPNPDDAYVTYFAPILDTSEQTWSYAQGVGYIEDTSLHTQSVIPSNNRFYQNKPQGFDITSTGRVIIVDENTDITGDEILYRDSLIITKGIWDDGLLDFTYTRESLEATMADDAGAPVDYKVAFGPDGQTGYIVAIGDNGTAEQIEGFQNFYPIYWKTTDAGVSWDGPHEIQIDGPSGMNGIVNYHLTDEQIAELFGPNPPARTEISYTTAYDCDIAVDYQDRLHIAVVIGPTGIDPYSIITAEGYLAAYDLFEENPTNPFCALRMGGIRTFRGYLGDSFEYFYDNRIQITTNPSADKVFVSWLDTDLENEDDNNRPNIWVRGFDVDTWRMTSGSLEEDGPINVTLFSAGMWQAHLFAAPKTAFESDGLINIPFVFVELDSNDQDPLLPIQFKYIQDFTIDYYSWCSECNHEFYCGWVGIEEQTVTRQSIDVEGNIPNPFREETSIQMELYRSDNVNVSVYSISGQQLFEVDFGRMEQGKHQLPLKFSGHSSGVYFYTVTAGQHSVTRKMVVE